MSRSIHNVQIRTTNAEQVLATIKHDPALSLFGAYVAAPVRGWTALFPQRIDKGEKTAKLLSQKLKTDAFSLRTYSDQAFLYRYFYAGEARDAYSSSPDALREAQEMDDALGHIVKRWEEGELSSTEYHQAVTEYMTGHEERIALLRHDAARHGAGQALVERIRTIHRLVHEALKGSEAKKLIFELAFAEVCHDQPTLPETQARQRTLELIAPLDLTAPSAGGSPAVFRHLLDDDAMARLDAILRQRSTLPAFAAIFGFGNFFLSYQHIIEGEMGESPLTRFEPEAP